MATPLVFEAFWRDRGAIAGAKSFRKEVDATHGSFSKLSTASSKFSGLGGLAFKAAGVAAVGFGLKVASGNEQARISFTTMLGSAQKADVFLRKLQQFAATTPFEFPELQTAASSLISAGINADKVIPIMRTLGDVTAGMGTGAEGVKRATIALQQMNAAGRITGEDLNQLRDAGIPVYDLLAAATGKSKEEVVKLAQAGKLGKKELGQMMAALESGKGLERFSGLMEKQAQSLAGMVSTLKDNLGQGLADLLTPFFPAIKASIGAFNDLGSGAKTTFAVVAGGAVVLGLAAKGALGLSAGFRTLGASASAARIATGGVGAALGIATLAFGLYAAKHAEAKQRVADFTQAMQGETAAIKENVTAVAAKQLQDSGAFAAAQKLGLSLDLVTRAALGERAALDEVNSVVDHYTQAGLNSADVDANIRVDAANDLGRAIGQTGGAYNKAVTEARQMEAATGGAAGAMQTGKTSAEQLITATNQLKGAQRTLNTELQKSIDKFTILREGALSTERANLAWEESIDAVRDSTKENGKSLDSHTAKGRTNRGAVINMITALNDKVTADVKNAGAVRKGETAQDRYERVLRVATRSTKNGEVGIRAAARAAGLNEGAVNRMIRQYLKTPKQIRTDVKTPGVDAARNKVRGLDTDINNLNSKSINLTASYRATAAKAARAFFSHVPGSQASSFAHLPLGGPPRGSSLNSMIGAPVATPEGSKAAGGPTVSRAVTIRHSSPGASQSRWLAQNFDDAAARAASYTGLAGLRAINSTGRSSLAALAAAQSAAATSGTPGGRVGIVPGAGWSAIQAAMRRHGARRFTTYPGHHPTMERARDVTPHNWAAANAARALSGVWYVIYRMRIASKNHGNIWRQYHPTSRRGDWTHNNHIHVARYDGGGRVRPGQLAYNHNGGVERMLSARQNVAYERMVRVAETRGGAGNTYYVTVNAPIGAQADLRNNLMQMARRGDIDNIVKLATRA